MVLARFSVRQLLAQAGAGWPWPEGDDGYRRRKEEPRDMLETPGDEQFGNRLVRIDKPQSEDGGIRIL